MTQTHCICRFDNHCDHIVFSGIVRIKNKTNKKTDCFTHSPLLIFTRVWHVVSGHFRSSLHTIGQNYFLVITFNKYENNRKTVWGNIVPQFLLSGWFSERPDCETCTSAEPVCVSEPNPAWDLKHTHSQHLTVFSVVWNPHTHTQSQHLTVFSVVWNPHTHTHTHRQTVNILQCSAWSETLTHTHTHTHTQSQHLTVFSVVWNPHTHTHTHTHRQTVNILQCSAWSETLTHTHTHTHTESTSYSVQRGLKPSHTHTHTHTQSQHLTVFSVVWNPHTHTHTHRQTVNILQCSAWSETLTHTHTHTQSQHLTVFSVVWNPHTHTHTHTVNILQCSAWSESLTHTHTHLCARCAASVSGCRGFSPSGVECPAALELYHTPSRRWALEPDHWAWCRTDAAETSWNKPSSLTKPIQLHLVI